MSAGGKDGCEVRESRRLKPDKLLCSDSLPVVGMAISSIDLDVTVRCNLACDYCFKEKNDADMSLETAQDAICWLIFASQNARRLLVSLIGGEPLLRFDLIKKLVPFAKRRAYQHNKAIHFGITTNGTIMSDEIIEFWRKWGIGFHTSIDGVPVVHDRHRHFRNGMGSSHLLERNLPRILELRPQTTARATVLPDTVEYLSQSFEYLLGLGYGSVAFVPGALPEWDGRAREEFGRQFEIISNRMTEHFREGRYIRVKYFDEGCKALASGKKPRLGDPVCGAGRGMVLIDVNGDIWPCHRWSKRTEKEWRLGSIYEPNFNYSARSAITEHRTAERMERCRDCEALFLCSGGCPAEDLEDTGSIFERHRRGCDLMVTLAERVIRFHDKLLAERNPLFMKTYYKTAKRKGGDK
ncbi:MAG: SPASM domain-containing protein [Sedimentisphaerales bacterium]|nr:SPASM domain-containing protein [Sedimentisphaerales bacterium]